ncbi:restriction endonuclease [Enterocloster bolteae]|jgi:hypothetical protein|uniref:Restriction endonuclease type IV Mrr domain-containing protein n=1 Tax=Enterocloster bolteae 90B8 TaxID=997897 RepID=N9ZDV0_9FIRM|nr:restriction endonuclease [Enterocloster bolteae]ENZ38051.1 hypothetical protein HMPREF1097_02633 [Enterocloster bolteae 90B8]
MVTRTINQLHFEDLDPIRFEELILAMVYRMRRWDKLDHFGKKGSDDGIDIRAVELLENGKSNTYYFQCKRYKKITKAIIKNIVDDYTTKNSYMPQFYVLVISCALTKVQIEYFESYCKELGFNTVTIWTSSVIEAMLFTEYHDLLFAYFGINLVSERKALVGSIRRNVALKKQMKRDFLKQSGCRNREELDERLNKPWTKFNHSEVLIRSIYDKAYPKNTLSDKEFTGYYKAEVYNFYHNGLMVRAYPYVKDIKYKQEKLDNDGEFEIIDLTVDLLGCIPFDNIIEYDIEGDEYYNYPHLFCDFVNISDPYEKIVYLCDDGYIIDEDEAVQE